MSAATGAGVTPDMLKGAVPQEVLDELKRFKVSAQDAFDVTNTINEMLL